MAFSFPADYFDDHDFGGGGFDDDQNDFAVEHAPYDDPKPSTSKAGKNEDRPPASIPNKFIKKHATKQIDQVTFNISLVAQSGLVSRIIALCLESLRGFVIGTYCTLHETQFLLIINNI